VPKSDAERRLLELLAANPAGCNEFLLLAHGAGLATTSAVTVTHIKLTNAGQLALADGR
jgi:hypothetical protein